MISKKHDDLLSKANNFCMVPQELIAYPAYRIDYFLDFLVLSGYAYNIDCEI